MSGQLMNLGSWKWSLLMIILCWLKSPSSIPKIASIERLLLRILKQVRTISAQPNSNQTCSELL